MPDLFDVIELVVDIPEKGLRAGMQGTIVECHPGDTYEVEFANELGETVELLALRPEQFIVVWQSKTRTWVPIADQVAALLAHLPDEAGQEKCSTLYDSCASASGTPAVLLRQSGKL